MRTTRTATGIALATLAAIAVATGTAAAFPNGNGTGTCTGTGTPVAQGPMAQAGTAQGQGLGQGMGRGMGRGMGQGMGQRGTGLNLSAQPSGTLTAAQRAELASMAEEEKMAHDVYIALAAEYPALVQFDRIANAENQHLTTVRLMLDKYGIDDPTEGYVAGEFASQRFDDLYADLLASATTSAKALEVGVLIEETDIADLEDALSGLTAADVTQVFTHLLAGSERHLVAFGG